MTCTSCLQRPPKTKGLCQSCYKKAYRIKNSEKIKTQEAALRKQNPQKFKDQSNKFKQSSSGLYATARSEAARRGLSFDMSLEDFLYIRSLPCDYCDSIEFSRYGHRLDRIENSMGYHVNNVVPCCTECNKIRMHHLSYIEMHVVAKSLKRFRSTLYE